MYCTKCGNMLPDDAKFCPACGASTDRESSNKYKKNEKPLNAKHYQISMWILIALTVILSGFCFFGSDGISALSLIACVVLLFVIIIKHSKAVRYGVKLLKINEVNIKSRKEQQEENRKFAIAVAVIILFLFYAWEKIHGVV